MIYLFFAQGFEEIEGLAAVDVLRRAELPVTMVGVGGREVTGAHGIRIICDISGDEARPDDMELLMLPGGMPGTLHLEQSPVVQRFLDEAVRKNCLIAAICAAPSILGHRGLLSGRKATCFPGFEEQLTGAVLSEDAVCVDGNYVTGKGMGVAVEFALKLVELLTSRERAEKLKASLQCRR